jgi:F0F1-type ATP synthase gamma subunit
VFLEKREVKKILVCVVASDRGFCGSFNSNLIRFTNKELSQIENQGEIEIMPLERKQLILTKTKRILAIIFRSWRLLEVYSNKRNC